MQSVSEVQDRLTELYGFAIPQLFAEAKHMVLKFMAEGCETFTAMVWVYARKASKTL